MNVLSGEFIIIIGLDLEKRETRMSKAIGSSRREWGLVFGS